ncbi:hypothetical protein, partial [Enterobacter cloacae]|uniref:hypothetical protein n=1 Tax=Enterobacter cloacae TaxID=550 RepID=UPI0039C3960D
PTTYLVDTTLSDASDYDQTVHAVRLLLIRRFTSFALQSDPSPCAVVFICPPFLQVLLLNVVSAVPATPCHRELIQQEKGFQPAR